MRIDQGFQQPAPVLPDPWQNDPCLRGLMKRLIDDDEVLEIVEKDLEDFGKVVTGPITRLGAEAYPPSLIQYDHYGQRVDTLNTSHSWRELKSLAATSGLVALHHATDLYGPHARVYGFGKTYLWAPSSRMVACPVSMTDGAVRVLDLAGGDGMKDVRERLMSRDPERAWSAGQWMTERPGGSDISRTETTAVPAVPGKTSAGDPWLLNGLKWFSSATDGDIALALARTDPDPKSGNKGLSLFLVKMRLDEKETAERFALVREKRVEGEREEGEEERKKNGVRIHRLKNKIGTHILPTAELTLQDTVGHLIGPLGSGIRTISSVLNITRLHSTFTSVSYLRRSLDIATSFAKVRLINSGQQKLSSNPLHTATLAKVAVLQRALLHLAFGAAHLLGRSEASVATREEEDRLRLLTPVVKAFAAGRATGGMAECMEAMGGQGYMEESGVGILIRDALVERIWEGTQNVLALDVLRVVNKSKGGALQDLIVWMQGIIDSAKDRQELSSTIQSIQDRLTYLITLTKLLSSDNIDPRLPRPLINVLGSTVSSIFMLEHVVWEGPKGNSPEHDALIWWVEGAEFTTARLELDAVLQGEEGKMRRELVLVYGDSKL